MIPYEIFGAVGLAIFTLFKLVAVEVFGNQHRAGGLVCRGFPGQTQGIQYVRQPGTAAKAMNQQLAVTLVDGQAGIFVRVAGAERQIAATGGLVSPQIGE